MIALDYTHDRSEIRLLQSASKKGLALIAIMALSLMTTACGSKSEKVTATTDITLSDFTITPSALQEPTGTVKFHVHNDGHAVHNFAIRTLDKKQIGISPDLKVGQAKDVTITLQPGSYETYCEEPGHEGLGMKGTLTVQ